MGKAFAPNFVNLVLAYWEHQLFQQTHLQPIFYCRFLDNIFMIWHHSHSDLEEFLSIADTIHPKITLDTTTSPTHINFLDITIYKGANFNATGLLDTKLYVKPTNPQNYLHYSSYHPPHTFNGIYKGQLIRLARLSSTYNVFLTSAKKLTTRFLTRGYPVKLLTRTYRVINNKIKQAFATQQPPISLHTKKRLHTKIVLFIVPYSARNISIASIIKKKYKSLQKNNATLKNIKFMQIFTKNKNIKQYITKAALN